MKKILVLLTAIIIICSCQKEAIITPQAMKPSYGDSTNPNSSNSVQRANCQWKDSWTICNSSGAAYRLSFEFDGRSLSANIVPLSAQYGVIGGGIANDLDNLGYSFNITEMWVGRGLSPYSDKYVFTFRFTPTTCTVSWNFARQ